MSWLPRRGERSPAPETKITVKETSDGQQTVSIIETVRHDRLALLAAALSLVVLLTAGVSAVLILNNADRIEANERNDVLALRQASFRICKRGAEDRAELHASALTGGVGERNLPLLRDRQSRIPIRDCSPNLVSGPAAALKCRGPHREQLHEGLCYEQIRYVHYFLRHDRAPCTLNGRVDARRPPRKTC